VAATATDLDAVLAGWAALDEDALGRPWVYRGRTMNVREALHRTLEDAQEALVSVAERPHPESRRILALAERALGSLRGLVVGLPGDLLDRAPRPGEWSLRETLRHLLLIERRYAIQTAYAVERGDGDPVRIADDRLPTAEQVDVSGGAGDLLARLGEARAETNRRLGDVSPAAMARPTVWAGHDVDVRFRLHRFAPHVVEHTIQCEKTLSALGWAPAEGRRIVREISALLGLIEGLGGAREVRAVGARLAERLIQVSAPPA